MVYYSCPWPTCKRKFVHLRHLRSHLHIFHSSSQRAALYCGINDCQLVYSTGQSFRKHLERSHHALLTAELPEISETSTQAVSAEVTEGMECENVVDITGNDEHNRNTFKELMTRRFMQFALKVCEEHILPKSVFHSLMHDLCELTKICQEDFLQSIMKHLNNTCDIQTLNSIQSDATVLSNIWDTVDTDQKFLNACKSLFAYVPGQEIVLGKDTTSMKKMSFRYVPITETLKSYLMHDDVLEAISVDPLSKPGVISEFTDGTVYQENIYCRNHPGCLMLHLYIDEVELCNPLGSAKKKHKITAVYMTVGNIPRKYLSALRNIHLVLLCPSVVAKKYGLEVVLQNAISDIRTLESDGISVHYGGHVYHFHGTVVSVSGDNLASHELGGFRMCFSSGRICRYCMITYDTMKNFTSESDAGFPILRTQSVHEMHVKSVVNDSSLSAVYGVRGDCCMRDLETFNAITHLPPDVMHDVLEGVVPKSLSVILKKLLSNKVMSVKQFDSRLSAYKFGSNDRKDIPPLLGNTFFSSEIHGTAAQNYTLLRMLPYLIGDLVPVNDETWELYIILRSICDIVLAPVVHDSWLPVLDSLICDHHRLLLSYDSAAFTPKMHFLCHYPRLFTVYGPLRHLWCMRYEAYHHCLKSIVHHTGNFKDICRTLTERNQLRKCWEQSGSECLQSSDDAVSGRCVVHMSALPISVQSCVSDFFLCDSNAQLMSVTSVNINCVKCAVNDFFVLECTHEEIPVFICLKHILCMEGSWCLIGSLVICDAYLRHYQCFKVCDTQQLIAISPGSELDYHALSSYTVCDNGVEICTVSLRHRIGTGVGFELKHKSCKVCR